MNIEKLFSREPKIIRRNNAESDKLALQNQKVEKRKRVKTEEPKIIRRAKEEVNGLGKLTETSDPKSIRKNEIKDDKPGEPESFGRRRFLKIAGAAAVAFGTGVGLKEMLEEGDAKNSDKENEEKARELKKINQEEFIPSEDQTAVKEPELDKEQQTQARAKKSEKETIEINNLADHYLKAYLEISKDPEKFPEEIFEKDLLIAQQCQESRGEIDAESRSGALGEMQNMTISIIDVTRYLNKLKRNTGFEWNGPEELSKDDIKEIKKLIIQKSDYSRAFGKIYLMQLWDNKYGYSVGRKKFEEGDVAGAQIELMGAYNAGLGRVKGKNLSEWKKLKEKYRHRKDKKSQKEFRAYDEVITYVEKIFNYKERIGSIREAIKKEAVIFDSNEDYAARELCLKLDAIRDKGEGLKKYLAKFKNINLASKKKVSYRDIDIILES